MYRALLGGGGVDGENSSRSSYGDNIASTAWGARILGRLLVGLLARRAGVEGIRPRHGSHRRQLRAHVLERVRRRVVLLGLGVVEVRPDLEDALGALDADDGRDREEALARRVLGRRAEDGARGAGIFQIEDLAETLFFIYISQGYAARDVSL